jgi:hypothetical protein
MKINVMRIHGRAMAQAVSLRSLTAEAWFRDGVNPCGICCGQSGSGTGFLRGLQSSPVRIIIQCFSMLLYHLEDEQ